MRIALIVGVNHYDHMNGLYGCVADASDVNSALAYNHGDLINFESKLLLASGPGQSVTRAMLKDNIASLFRMDAEIALFFFAGHGHIEETGGYLLASDSRRGDEGVALAEILRLANESPAQNKVIILDSCHSGIAGADPNKLELSTLARGVTILTASTEDQYATEMNGRGLFTSLLVDALNGGAASLTGDVTPGSLYSHIDQSLGVWEQRPVFKTNVKKFVSLKRVTPPIPIQNLRRINEFFPIPGMVFKLDPTFEPQMKGRDPGMPPPDPENCRIFAILQEYNRQGLLVPVGVKNMWDAAMQSTGCKLTALGEHYRRLAEKKRL